MGWELSRRTFFKGAGALAAGLATACDGLTDDPARRRSNFDAPLALPRGFRQKVLSRAGQSRPGMPIVPGNHDGMVALPHGRNAILVRNHELLPDAEFPVQGSDPFDPDDAGGVTALVVSPRREVIREFTLLSGTRRNCAGGATPWGTWLTCEEFRDDAHGFVFEVAPEEENEIATRPIRAMGHFRHGAVAFDPETGVGYLTEDAPPTSFVYRFLPTDRSGRPGSLHAGGRLQAMRVQDDTGPPGRVGDVAEVGWIDVDPDEAPETGFRSNRRNGDAETRQSHDDPVGRPVVCRRRHGLRPRDGHYAEWDRLRVRPQRSQR